MRNKQFLGRRENVEGVSSAEYSAQHKKCMES